MDIRYAIPVIIVGSLVGGWVINRIRQWYNDRFY